MDRFVTKTPRAVDKKRSRGDDVHRPEEGLALCSPVDAIRALEIDAIALFDSYPREQWYDLGKPPMMLFKRQLLFGARGSDNPAYFGRQSHDPSIPPVLLSIYRHARNALCKTFPDLPDEPSGCAINRYDPTENRKGSGLGPHRDAGAWKPLVVGVTLVEWREMAFSDGYKGQATKTHKIRTEPGSVYCFRDEMFTKWYHESLKKGAKHEKTIYSITYRFL